MSTKVNKTQVKGNNTRTNNRTKNSSKRKAQEITSFEGVTVLKSNVTGKMRRAAILDASKAIKVERASYSRCIADIFNVKGEYYTQMKISKTQMKKALTPAMIKNQFSNFQLELAINALEDEKRGYIKYSPYFTMQAIEKAMKNTEPNPLAVAFFNALNTDIFNQEEYDKAVKAIRVARAEYKAEKEAKKNS